MWKETAERLTREFMAWGCRYDKRKLPGIAMGYDCTPLFFWNWMEDGETDRTEKGFLRVLGYAWRKALEEEDSLQERRERFTASCEKRRQPAPCPRGGRAA